MKCKDCKYVQIGLENSFCKLTNLCIVPDEEGSCVCFNIDLSKYNICYNCKHYVGGGDWGLFCSHKDNYHHLGHFNDKPCKHYINK